MTEPHKLTVLTCTGPDSLATKKFVKDQNGKIYKKSFSAGKFFTHEEKSFTTLEELAVILSELESQPKKFVVKGAVKAGAEKRIRRLLNGDDATILAKPCGYVMLDIDKLSIPDFLDVNDDYESVIKWILDTLPEPFQDVDCYYQFSSSQNVPIQGVELKSTASVHVWFLFSEPVSNGDLKRYFKAEASHVDRALFSSVQIHYTANPIFVEMSDPLECRSGLFRGEKHVVDFPKLPKEDKKATMPRPNVKIHVDPEDKKKAIDLVLPHYKEGWRDRLSGAIAGTLYRKGWDDEDVAHFIYELALAGNDEEAIHREKSAFRICEAVDNHLPAQGIPTLKEEFPEIDLDMLLTLLGVGKVDVDQLLKSLGESSSVDDVIDFMQQLANCPVSKQEEYIEKVEGRTKKSRGVLRAYLKEAKSEFQLPVDWADIVMSSFLNGQYSGGKHFMRSEGKSYWFYTGTYWKAMPDDLVKKEMMKCAREIIHEGQLPLGLDSLVKSSMNLLEGEAFDEHNVLRDINRDVVPVINCLNGELTFSEGGTPVLKPHRADSYLRSCLDVVYDPYAQSPKFDQALLDIFRASSDPKDMCRHFLEFAGYACQNWRKVPSIFFMYGGGANGKSSLMSIIKKVIGHDAVYSGSLQGISKDKFAIGALDGKLLAHEDDVKSNARLDDGFLKMISEEKLMKGEHKFKDSFSFVCRALPVMCGNSFPAISDLTDGIKRRLHVIPFSYQFHKDEQDLELFDNIWNEERSGVLNCLVQGFLRVKERGKFDEPQDCINMKLKWITKSNILPTFVSECCEINESASQRISDVYAVFREYCEETGVDPIPRQQWLRDRLEQMGYEISKSNGWIVVRGIQASKVQEGGGISPVEIG